MVRENIEVKDAGEAFCQDSCEDHMVDSCREGPPQG